MLTVFPHSHRLYRDDIEGIIALKKFQDQISLDCLYLDSTFLSINYVHFPSQRKSVDTIINLTAKWLQAHPKNVLFLRPPANYGYEFLLVQLSQHFKVKIHVANATFQDYQYIPDFDSYISDNPTNFIFLSNEFGIRTPLYECCDDMTELTWQRKVIAGLYAITFDWFAPW